MNSVRSALVMAWLCSLLFVGVWSYSWGVGVSLEQTDTALYVASLATKSTVACRSELDRAVTHIESLMPTWEQP